MPRITLPLAAAALVLLLPLPAVACIPIPPKTWTGHVETSAVGAIESVSFAAFRASGCSWTHPELNGLDARAFDVASHKGLPSTLSWSTSALLDDPPTLVWGYVLTAACELEFGPTIVSPARDLEVRKGEKLPFTIPQDAKWLVLVPSAFTPRGPYDLKITSPGRVCPKP